MRRARHAYGLELFDDRSSTRNPGTSSEIEGREVGSLLLSFRCFEDEKTDTLAPDEAVGENDLRMYKSFVCADY
ncbi:hypothetical protein GQ457_04G035850 [Hibiscus cannabinus]